jgi:acetyl esterase/lipase
MIVKTIRWIGLIGAASLATISLLTVFKAPGWMDWRLRMAACIFLGEWGMFVAVVPLVVGVATWFFDRKHRRMFVAATAFRIVAIALLLRPTIQALSMERSVRTQLLSAFGPATVDRSPFSFSRVFARTRLVGPVEILEYSNGLMLDFYPAVGRSPSPCVVAIHGGGWMMGDRRESAVISRFYHWVASEGYSVAAIDYRLAPQAIWPAQRDDVLAAIAYLRTNSEHLKIDPQRIVLMGRSAGGELAEATAYGNRDPGIRGVSALYGPTDLKASWEGQANSDSFPQRRILEQYLGGTPATAPQAYEEASGARVVRTGDPPTLLIHGGLDSLVPLEQSELLAKKLDEAGVPHALIVIPWDSHGFDYLSFDGPGGQITAYAVEWFLNAVTK